MKISTKIYKDTRNQYKSMKRNGIRYAVGLEPVRLASETLGAFIDQVQGMCAREGLPILP